MANNIPKPENTLKRAEELISVGQHSEALNVLHATISHRRLKAHGWDLSTELIMLRYVRLCVDLDKLKLVREGLHFYRYLTHQHNVVSLAKVMKELRELSEAKLEAVKARADAEALARGVDDLEADETPESLLLSTLQIDVRDDTAKALHAALLGCWETYKIIMDLLRFAPKIDYLYHDTAQRALEFCRVNQRPQEFRRLCETLRLHYANFQRNRGKPDYEALTRPESHLTTRLTQMAVAADLSLWTQCFQTAEDILSLGLHELLQRSLVTKDPTLHKMRGLLLSQTATFYDKLAQMFFVSGQRLFHASATLRNLFHTRQHKRNVTEAEQLRLCDVGTLAVLCVPILDKKDQTAVELEYQKRLASMLAHGGIPTRASMQHVIETRGIVAAASPTVQTLYSLIEGDVDPMTICSKIQALLADIATCPHLVPYIPALKQVVFDKLMLRLSGIYLSISIDFFTNSVCPESFLPWREAEALIVHLVDQGFVKVRLDYAQKLLIFADSATSSDHMLKNRLVHVASVLSDFVPRMQVPGKTLVLTEAEQNRRQFYNDFPAKLEAEATRLSNRNRAVADRRLKQEKEQQAKEEARRTEEKEKQKKEELEEQIRREAALKHQETIRRKEAQQQLKIEVSKQIVAEFKAIADRAIGRIIIRGRPIDEITSDQILNGEFTYEDYEKAQEELRTRERQEKHRQHRQELKRIEHVVRAIREEEARVLPQWKQQCRIEDDMRREQCLKSQETKAQEQFQKAVARREAFLQVQDIVEDWIAAQMAQKQAEYDSLVQDRLTKLKTILKQKKIQRARARYEADIAKKREEEILRKKQEEEKRRKEEEAARARTAEKQRLKDQEIEEREREREQERAQAATATTTRVQTVAPRRPSLPREEWRRSEPDRTTEEPSQPTSQPTSRPEVSKPGKYVLPALRQSRLEARREAPSKTESRLRHHEPSTSTAAEPSWRQTPPEQDVQFSRTMMAPPASTRPATTTTAAPPVAAPDGEGFTVVTKKQKPRAK